MNTPNTTELGSSKSRTNSTYASSSVRPRAKRFISGFEDFSTDLPNPATFSPDHQDNAPFFSRIPSPIPSKHPSRSSSLKPPLDRNSSAQSAVNGDLAASLSGLWGRSWTSLQGLASNVLGSDASADSIKDNMSHPRKSTSASANSKQWGPRGAPQTQPGGGSKQERSAVIRAKKRQELLSSNGSYYGHNGASTFKRRLSDDFTSNSAPPAESDDRLSLVYVHHVAPQDTLPGISIRYNCQLVTLKRVNRLWSNDGVQARKTLVIPVDACTIRGLRVDGPNTTIQGINGQKHGANLDLLEEVDDRRSSTQTITPRDVATNGQRLASPRDSKPADDLPWTHDSWTILEGQTTPTEIARLPRQHMGYFPRARRKSGSLSDLDRSSTSLDYSRPSITLSESSSGKRSLHRSRRSSGSTQFAQQMMGPGGVGSLKGRGPSTPGPAEDKLTNVFRRQVSAVRVPSASDEDYLTSSASTPSFSEFGHAVEGWAKKVSKGIAKALEAPPSNDVRQQRRAAGFGSTTSGDLIELENAYTIGDDDGDTPTNADGDRGRRGSFTGPNDGFLSIRGRQHRSSRSRSHEGDSFRRKGD